MTSERNKNARRIVLWMLYATDISKRSPQAVLASSLAIAEEFVPDAAQCWDLVTERVTGAYEQLDTLNAEIQALSPRWRLDRMAAVDRNLLRLGAAEILLREIPPIITINACIELAKLYGDKSTPAFVNGLLDQFCKNHAIPIN
ncbi:MAG: transcription antitermination factor NusB [Bradymonadaceae bacterium]|nr:transcription antitermination factor NusB [Lujinxingiaceae bacterium]